MQANESTLGNADICLCKIFCRSFYIFVNDIKYFFCDFFIFIFYIFTFVNLLFTAYCPGLRAAGPKLVIVDPVSFRLLGGAGISKQNGSSSCSTWSAAGAATASLW